MLSSRHLSSWFLLIIANVMWATSYVAAKFVLQETSVAIMLALRMGISAIALLPLLIIKRKDLRLTRKELPQLAILILIGFVVNNLLEYTGLALSFASDVALLISCESIFTAILSWMLLREPFKKATIYALCLGLGGVYLVIERGLVPNIQSGGNILRILGDLLVVLALFFEALYTVRGKAMLVKHQPVLITSAAIVGSIIFWAPVTGWLVLTTGWHPLSPLAWLSITWIALMSTVVAYLAWFQGLAKIDGTAAASTLFLQPFLGTILAFLLLKDQITGMSIVGGIFIVTSVFLLSRR